MTAPSMPKAAKPDEVGRLVTIVTSDWKGSTSLGEKLDAESLRDLQTRYFDEMQLVFEAHGGRIEKIIGDALVAVFGLPVEHEHDALRGVAAAAEAEPCTTCGHENPPGRTTCLSCGARLAAPGQAAERRKTVTLVFANPRVVTESGDPPSPEAARSAMTDYFDLMRRILEKHGATVEKFIGDAVMAVFGLAVLHEDDALRATRAALEMQAALPGLNGRLARTAGCTVQMQVGVNTGEVIAGDANLGQRLVTGDAVNTAARLEQAAAPGDVLIGELTHRLVRDASRVEPVEPLTLKGKAELVPAYRLLTVERVAAEGFHRRQDTPMVGREHEMGLLSETFLRARNEAGARMALVVADAGTGKSRLIREFVDACDADA